MRLHHKVVMSGNLILDICGGVGKVVVSVDIMEEDLLVCEICEVDDERGE